MRDRKIETIIYGKKKKERKFLQENRKEEIMNERKAERMRE